MPGGLLVVGGGGRGGNVEASISPIHNRPNLGLVMRIW